jgi:hypothetical protein
MPIYLDVELEHIFLSCVTMGSMYRSCMEPWTPEIRPQAGTQGRHEPCSNDEICLRARQAQREIT